MKSHLLTRKGCSYILNAAIHLHSGGPLLGSLAESCLWGEKKGGGG